MKRQVTLLLIAIHCIVSLTISGCWSRREVENLAVVSAFGIDKDQFNGKPKYKVICNIFRPSQAGAGAGGPGGGGGGGGVSPSSLAVWQITGLGDTIDDAFTNLSTQTPRDLFLGHARLIVLGKDLAKEGTREAIDFFLRNRDIRPRTWMIVVDGKAQDAMRTIPDLEPTIAAEAAGVADLTRFAVSKFYVVNLNQFINAMVSEGMQPITGRAELVKPVPPHIEAGQSQSTLTYRGAAVFLGDKWVGWLEDNEAKGFLFITGKARRGVIPVNPGDDGKPDVSLEMQNAESKISPEIRDGKLYVKVKITAEASMAEQGSNSPLATPEGMEKLSALFAKHIREICMKSVQKAKQYKADIFGFGAELHRKHPEQWHEVRERWPEIFANAQVDIQVKAKITHTGLLSETIKPK